MYNLASSIIGACTAVPISARVGALCFICLLTSVAGAAPRQKIDFKWPSAVQWVSFAEGQSLAASTNKPMLILVYASWCKQCRALAKALDTSEFIQAAKAFVMVLADHDNDDEGLTYYTPKLSYVPRIFFMQPNGEFWAAMQSGNVRYPYFYTPKNLSILMKNMRTSLARHSEK